MYIFKLCMYACMYVCMYVCMYACKYVSMYVGMHVPLCVCVCVCVLMRTPLTARLQTVNKQVLEITRVDLNPTPQARWGVGGFTDNMGHPKCSAFSMTSPPKNLDLKPRGPPKIQTYRFTPPTQIPKP